MHAAIRSPLAAGVALIGAGAIAAIPIAATPPDVHVSDIRLTLSTIASNPIALSEELVGRTLSDTVSQTRRAASFPIAKALVLNLANAVGGGVPVGVYTVGASPSPLAGADARLAGGGGLLGTVRNLALDGVGTTARLVPASVEAVLGVAESSVNAVTMTGLSSVRAVLNVGAAALTLNPAAVLDAAALGAVRVASVVEGTTIGAPTLMFKSPQASEVMFRRVPSIVSSILNGRQEIANAIFPTAIRAQAASAAATPAVTAGVTSKSLVKTTASTTHKAVSPAAKHAKK
jgi:hypothetical protein